MDYVIGLGANLGSRRASLEAAIALLAGEGARVARVSKLYESEPIGPPQPRYYNAAVRVHSELGAHDLLARLLEIERRLGRTRAPAERWRARTLDLDILWAEVAVQSAELSIPHAHLRERWFALAPLLDVAPELVADYGPSLAALGGAPPARDDELGRERGEVRALGGGLCAQAFAGDREDAVADALGALGRSLWPAGESSAVEVLSGAAAADPLAAFVHAALDLAAGGFSFARATLCRASDQRFEGRLLGSRRAHADVPVPTVRAVHHEAHEGGVHARIELAP